MAGSCKLPNVAHTHHPGWCVLQELRLPGNVLSGSLPPLMVGTQQSLRVLDLAYNQIT